MKKTPVPQDHIIHSSFLCGKSIMESLCDKTVSVDACRSSKPNIALKDDSCKIALKGECKTRASYKIFNCLICQKALTTKSCLLKHMSVHGGSEHFQCSVCGKFFATEVSLKKHINMHYKEEVIKCEMCDSKFCDNDSLRSHMKLHISSTRFHCEFCKETFADTIDYKRHMMGHSSERKLLECEICSEKFTIFRSYKIHLRVHTGEKPYECELCGKAFSTNRGVTKHYHMRHSGKNSFQCDFCQNSFFSETHLKSHQGAGPFKCGSCEVSIHCNRGVQLHRKIHPNVGYKCEICNKSYSSPYRQRRHVCNPTTESASLENQVRANGHSGVLYECEICSKKFALFSYYKVHLRVHTGEKPYECELCRKTFSRISDVTTHKRLIHSSSFLCDFCENSFPSETRLNCHLGIGFFKCELCEVSIRCKRGLQLHREMHPDVAYKCEICKKSYSKPFSQRKHICKPTTESTSPENQVQVFPDNNFKAYLDVRGSNFIKESFKCDVCGKKFETKKGLNMHADSHIEKECAFCHARLRNKLYTQHMKEHFDKMCRPCDMCEKIFPTESDLDMHKKDQHPGLYGTHVNAYSLLFNVFLD